MAKKRSVTTGVTAKTRTHADPDNELPDNTYGSRHYVGQLIAKNELKRVRAMILLDMMGYKDLKLGRPQLSSKWLVDVIWQTAKQIGYGSQFTDGYEGVDDDDHAPFLRAGVDAIDIIQLALILTGTPKKIHSTRFPRRV